MRLYSRIKSPCRNPGSKGG